MSDKKILAVILFFLWMSFVFIFTDASRLVASGIGAYKIGKFCADMFLADEDKETRK